jgi:NAD(P) transhydrogenase subunit alpha
LRRPSGLGAVVTATDVRAAAGEQVESLGAKFIMTDALQGRLGLRAVMPAN